MSSGKTTDIFITQMQLLLSKSHKLTKNSIAYVQWLAELI